MRLPVMALLTLVFLAACSGSDAPTGPRTEGGPRTTITALSQTLRDRDFAAYAGLHTEEFFAEERTRWERSHAETLRDAEKVAEVADRLGMSADEVRGMTFRDATVAMFRFKVAEDPDWIAHLEHLTVLDEQTDGERSRLTVRYCKPKPDETHELLLILRDGRWLVHEWD